MAYEGAAEPDDKDHVLFFKIARDIGTEAGDAGLTDTQLRASPVPVDTEFPAAAVAADNTATPTTTSVRSFGMVYDGATWDMQRGDATNGTLVNLGKINGVTPSLGTGAMDAGTIRVVLASDGPTVTVLGGTTDAAVGDATGSINAHLRYLAGSAAVADNGVSSGNPQYVGGLAVTGSSYAPAYTAGDRAVIPIDKDSGGVLCHTRTLTTTDQVTNAPLGHSVNYISTATTTTVKSGAGVLHVLNLGETAAGAITIYDNTAASGTVIDVLKASIVEHSRTYDVAFSTGLTIVTAGASKLSVSYR